MNRLRELRKEKKLTVRKLSEKTGIAYASISFMENNIRPFTQENLEILCKFFDVSSDYLLGFSKEKKFLSLEDELQKKKFNLMLENEINGLTEKQAKELLKYIDYLKKRGDV